MAHSVFDQQVAQGGISMVAILLPLVVL